MGCNRVYYPHCIFMSRETIVFVSGVLLTIVPFLSVPLLWRQYVVFGVGSLLIVIGLSLRRSLYYKRIDKGNGERGTDSFVETTEKLFDEDTLQ
jgi:hypothetical protein